MGAGRPGARSARGPAGVSAIVDLSLQRRRSTIVIADPNTSLLWPRTVIPTLQQRLLPGEHWLAAAVLADPDPDAAATLPALLSAAG